MIRICLMIVDLPDSPAPGSKLSVSGQDSLIPDCRSLGTYRGVESLQSVLRLFYLAAKFYRFLPFGPMHLSHRAPPATVRIPFSRQIFFGLSINERSLRLSRRRSSMPSIARRRQRIVIPVADGTDSDAAF